jgi:CheY-like chemotaxis protein
MIRILVVDDEEAIRFVLEAILSRYGYEVESAEDGLVAMRKFKTQPFDIIITDIVMPEQEGLETIRKMKKEKPELGIIAISGGGRNGPIDYLSIAKKLGADFTFEKPWDNHELLEAVEQLTQRIPAH